jgi:hypothetical protein
MVLERGAFRACHHAGVMRLVAAGAALAMLGATVVLVYAGVLHYRGRPIPRWAVRLGAGLAGAGSAFGFFYLPDLGTVAPFLAVPAVVTFDLVRRAIVSPLDCCSPPWACPPPCGGATS